MKSKKKTIAWIVILIVIIALGIFAWTKNGNQMTEETPAVDSIEVVTPDTTAIVETPKVDSTVIEKKDSIKAEKSDTTMAVTAVAK